MPNPVIWPFSKLKSFSLKTYRLVAQYCRDDLNAFNCRWDRITARIQPSRIPCFSSSGRRGAGSYRLPAVKQGKLNFCPT